MNLNNRIRQTHRWLSLAFVVLVIVNIVINISPLGQEQITLYVGLFTLLPLAFLLLTGLYLFVLPYTARGRNRQPTD